jgi:hypothetical protein
MMVKGETVPEFYRDYVSEVHRIIEENARLEFECIWVKKNFFFSFFFFIFLIFYIESK